VSRLKKQDPKARLEKFRASKRVYKKTENHSYAGKRRTKYKTKSQLCLKNNPGQKTTDKRQDDLTQNTAR